MPTPPQELPRGTPARRATSRSVSSCFAAAVRASGVNVTCMQHSPQKPSPSPDVYVGSNGGNMSTSIKTMDEQKLAEEIVSVLDARVVRVCSDDRENLRY